MNNIAIIGTLSTPIKSIKKIVPNSRWIHYSDNEEALAATSVYGHLFSLIFLHEDTCFMPSTDMYTVIKNQHKKLPIILYKNTEDIVNMIKAFHSP